MISMTLFLFHGRDMLSYLHLGEVFQKIRPHFLTSKLLLFFEFLSTEEGKEGEEERGEEGEEWKRKEKEEEEEELI